MAEVAHDAFKNAPGDAGDAGDASPLVEAVGELVERARDDRPLTQLLLRVADAIHRELGDRRAGRPRPAVEAPDELPTALIGTRCRLMAEAMRWQTRRRQLLDSGPSAEVARTDADLTARARELDGCTLWMTDPAKHDLRSWKSFTRVAMCYDAVALAVETLRRAEDAGDPAKARAAFLLLGEAQSALRVAVDASGYKGGDPDQLLIFAWLRRETKARKIYVPQMQLKSPADPEQIGDVIGRLRALADSSDDLSAVKKVKFHAGKLADAPDPAAEYLQQHWAGLMTGLTSAVNGGAAINDRSLVAALSPLVGKIPDEVVVPSSAEAVLLAAGGSVPLDARDHID